MKTAFYPCCETDIVTPVTLMQSYVDRIVFCDIRELLHEWKRRQPKDIVESAPISEFVVGDAQKVMLKIPVIDVLYYRRDSSGEGGSGLYVLGDMFLRPLMARFSFSGGYIFTDGSNSRGGNFKRMVRRSGMEKFGRHFSATTEQPYLETYGLWRIRVSAPL
jgi:hypothetical protein